MSIINFVPWRIPKKGERFIPYFRAAEKKYNIPKNLLARIAQQESAFRDDVITGSTKSSAGAIGLMQIVPRWHPYAQPTDPIHSIDYAASFLSRLKNKFGTWPEALAAYNWGEGNLAKWNNREIDDMPTETINYMNQILNDIRIA